MQKESQVIEDYLRMSYFTIERLCYKQIESHMPLKLILDWDKAVWNVLGRMQARKACELIGIRNKTLGGLLAALELKFDSEQYRYRIGKQEPRSIQIEITECPWLKAAEETGDSDLAMRLSKSICPTGLAAWAREFNENISVNIESKMCEGSDTCKLILHSQVEATAPES